MELSSGQLTGLWSLALIVLGLCFAGTVNSCGEYNRHVLEIQREATQRQLEVQKVCVQAGHSPIECGVVRVQ